MPKQSALEKLQHSSDRYTAFMAGGVRVLGGATMVLAGAAIARESAKLGIDASQQETLQSMLPAVKSLGISAGSFAAAAVIYGPVVNRLRETAPVFDVPVSLDKQG